MGKVHEIIAKEISERIKKDGLFWRKDWTTEKVNYISENNYRGINLLLLDRAGEYLTWNQIQKKGGKVKKGSKSRKVIFYKILEKKQENGETKEIPMVRYYRVFHISDVEGIESEILNKNEEKQDAEEIIKNYKGCPEIIREDREQPSYNFETDTIKMPHREQFKSPQAYYLALFHEMIHSTGAKHREDRGLLGITANLDKYGQEELVAEIGAAMLGSLVGMDTDENLDNSAAYVKAWIEKIQGDPKMIFRASSQAQKALDHITGKKQKEKKQKESAA